MNREVFKEGDRIKIVGVSDCYIGGMVGHPTRKFLRDTFNKFDSSIFCFTGNTFEGSIKEVGVNNCYIVYDNDGYYCFTNNYNEMTKI